MSSGNIVKLDIGGTLFKTSKSTLTKFDGMLKTMLETNVPVAKDDSDCIFIDRDAHHFRVILNYMRDGKVKLPNSEQEVEEIQIEAQYYLITGLDELCGEKLRELTKAKELPFDEEVQTLNKFQLLQVIAKPKKPVLIIYYHIGSNGRTVLPGQFDIESFSKPYKHKLDIFFSPFTNMQQDPFVYPIHWLWSLHYRQSYSYGANVKKGENWLTSLEKDINEFFTENIIV